MGSNFFITGNPHNMLPMPAAGINPMTEFIQATPCQHIFTFRRCFIILIASVKRNDTPKEQIIESALTARNLILPPEGTMSKEI